jgi:hypothetical protein
MAGLTQATTGGVMINAKLGPAMELEKSTLSRNSSRLVDRSGCGSMTIRMVEACSSR